MIGFLILGITAIGTVAYMMRKPVASSTQVPGLPDLPHPDSKPVGDFVSDTSPEITADDLMYYSDATKIPVPSQDKWVKVELDGHTYLVAPYYIAPVGIGEAQKVAALNGATLPTPALVDAIYQQADLKIPASPRGPSSKPPSDFTAKTMNSPATHKAQENIIAGQMLAKSPNLDFKLMAGPYKDVVIGGQREVAQFDNKALLNHIGIYGFQQANGKPIQQFMWGHSPDWKDYSQGVRLVKQIA